MKQKDLRDRLSRFCQGSVSLECDARILPCLNRLQTPQLTEVTSIHRDVCPSGPQHARTRSRDRQILEYRTYCQKVYHTKHPILSYPMASVSYRTRTTSRAQSPMYPTNQTTNEALPAKPESTDNSDSNPSQPVSSVYCSNKSSRGKKARWRRT